MAGGSEYPDSKMKFILQFATGTLPWKQDPSRFARPRIYRQWWRKASGGV